MQRPVLHHAFGQAFVTLMLVTAVSALFFRDFRLPNVARHAQDTHGIRTDSSVCATDAFSLAGTFIALARGHIALHRQK